MKIHTIILTMLLSLLTANVNAQTSRFMQMIHYEHYQGQPAHNRNAPWSGEKLCIPFKQNIDAGKDPFQAYISIADIFIAELKNNLEKELLYIMAQNNSEEISKEDIKRLTVHAINSRIAMKSELKTVNDPAIQRRLMATVLKSFTDKCTDDTKLYIRQSVKSFYIAKEKPILDARLNGRALSPNLQAHLSLSENGLTPPKNAVYKVNKTDGALQIVQQADDGVIVHGFSADLKRFVADRPLFIKTDKKYGKHDLIEPGIYAYIGTKEYAGAGTMGGTVFAFQKVIDTSDLFFIFEEKQVVTIRPIP